jgi:ABC-type sugar transport system permease subunit
LEQRRRRIGIAAVLPALAVLAAILGYPILDSLWLSLHEVNVGASGFARSFVGGDNYLALFADPRFHDALLRSAYFTLVEVAAVVLLGLGVALLLTHPLGRSGIFRVMLLVPWAIAPVANAVLWKWILNANYGILNAVLAQIGLVDGYVTWLGAPWRALNMILVVDVWKSIPFIAILFIAGLSKIPPLLYRAARLDGANAWQQFRHVTLPALKPTIAVAVILQTLWSLRVFELIFVLTKGGPADGTVLLNFFAYRITFNFLDLGYGAAAANVVFAVSFLLAALYVRLLRPAPQRAA